MLSKSDLMATSESVIVCVFWELLESFDISEESIPICSINKSIKLFLCPGSSDGACVTASDGELLTVSMILSFSQSSIPLIRVSWYLKSIYPLMPSMMAPTTPNRDAPNPIAIPDIGPEKSRIICFISTSSFSPMMICPMWSIASTRPTKVPKSPIIIEVLIKKLIYTFCFWNFPSNQSMILLDSSWVKSIFCCDFLLWSIYAILAGKIASIRLR